MNIIIDAVSYVMGFFLNIFYGLSGNYGVSIILFAAFTKVILFPVNILIQKNSIKMVQLQPELNALKIKYIDDKDRYADEQLAVYKKHKYHPLLGVVPLILQLILVMGVLGAVYKPLSFILGISGGDLSILEQWLTETMNITDAGNSAQVRMIELIQSGAAVPSGLSQEALNKITGFELNFLGLDLGAIPDISGGLSQYIIPVLAGLSAYILCWAQNKVNILQLSAGKLNRIGTTVFMVGFSLYLVFLVPQAVGLYWICGNLFAIPPMLLLNIIIPPKKYVDLDYLNKVRAEAAAKEQKYKKYHKKEKADYKRFFSAENMHIMIYAEGKGFYKYFEEVIKYLLEYSAYEIHYVTSDPEDPILEDTRAKFSTYYIARDEYLIPLFMKLDCDVALLTTPDLEKYHIKRSRVRKDIEYIYMQHGIGSVTRRLRKGALDHFDTVFLTIKNTSLEIRYLEERYNTKRKRLVEIGCPLLDLMAEEYSASVREEDTRPQIIIAPSWQPDNIIDLCGEKLLDILSGCGYRVILRPHPQHVRHDTALFEMLKQKYMTDPNIEIQTDFSANSPVLSSDVLITDWSGICYEFAFITKKPVLFINTPEKIMNPEFAADTEISGWVDLRPLIGECIEPDGIEKAPEIIGDMLANSEKYRDRIEKAYTDNVYGIGKSGKLSALYIIRSVDEKNKTQRR